MFLLTLALASRAAPVGEGWVDADLDVDWDHIPGVSTSEERRERDGRSEIRLLISEEGLRALAARGISPAGYRADHRALLRSAAYRDGPAANEALEAAVARSGRAGLVEIGRSLEGIPILGAWFGVAPGQGAPVLRVLGGHHGDEPIAVEVALRLADALADGDGAEQRITELLDRSTLYVVPVVNPDGLGEGSRYNAAEVDLNRNYDYEWDPIATRAGSQPFSEPETRAVRTLALLDRPVVGVSLHAGAANLGWPWNFSPEPPRDAEVLTAIAERYLERCDTPEFWITQGSLWYETRGDTNDWAYARHGTLDYTLEVSLDKEPPPEQIDAVVRQHEVALLDLLSVPMTLSGRVYDSESGAPVEATVSLDITAAPSLTDPLTGSFYRVLLQTPAIVTASAPGYQSASVEVTDGRAEIALVRTSRAATTSPTVLGSGAPEISASGSALLLERPGMAPVPLDPGETLAASDLAPGLYTISTADGLGPVWANALLVESFDGARITGWQTDGTIEGVGFSEGSRVFGVWGETRHLVELPVRSLSDRVLSVDRSLAPEDEPVMIVALSGGSVLGIEDINRPRSSEEDERLRVIGASCSTWHQGRLVRSDGGRGIAIAPIFVLLSVQTLFRRRRP